MFSNKRKDKVPDWRKLVSSYFSETYSLFCKGAAFLIVLKMHLLLYVDDCIFVNSTLIEQLKLNSSSPYETIKTTNA